MRYDDWNTAICDYFTKQAAPGSLVYMTVDDVFIAALAARHGLTAENSVSSFIDAVRAQVRVCAADNSFTEITLTQFDSRDANNRPNGAAFLAACVLAAYRMGDAKDPKNFFGQLRSLLRFSEDGLEEGRPKGMETGKEEPLWRDWIRFLAEHNLISSAKPGELGSPNYYINYPISQTLLRYADREKLRGLFASVAFFHQRREPDLLMARIFALRQSLTPRLQRRLSSTTAERYAAWTEAIAELHEEYIDSRIAPTGAGALIPARANTLGVELLRQPGRSQRSGMGTPPYYEFVLKLRPGFGLGGFSGGDVPEILVNGEWLRLETDEENPSRTIPVCELTAAQIVAGGEFALRNAGSFTKASLPRRGFWIFFKDDDHPNSGIYQTGKPSGAGLSFVFLGENQYENDLKRLRGIEKIGYKTCVPFGATDWIEISDGQITHEDWMHLTAGDADLRNALRPRALVSVSLSGGIRIGKAYLPEAAPRITVRGAAPSYPANIVSLRGDKEMSIWDGDIKSFCETPVPNIIMNRPGLYRIEVGDGDQVTQRLLPVTKWDVITAAPDESMISTLDPLARLVWHAEVYSEK